MMRVWNSVFGPTALLVHRKLFTTLFQPLLTDQLSGFFAAQKRKDKQMKVNLNSITVFRFGAFSSRVPAIRA